MTRLPWLLLGIIIALSASILLKRTDKDSLTDQIDSARVITVRDSVRVLDTASRRALDSMRLAFKRRPIREVIRTLPGQPDTIRDTIAAPVAEVQESVIRATADSLATCQHDRDSLGRAVAVEQIRTSSTAEALRLLQDRPAPEPADIPSRSTWALIGAGAATAAIIFLSR